MHAMATRQDPTRRPICPNLVSPSDFRPLRVRRLFISTSLDKIMNFEQNSDAVGRAESPRTAQELAQILDFVRAESFGLIAVSSASNSVAHW